MGERGEEEAGERDPPPATPPPVAAAGPFSNLVEEKGVEGLGVEAMEDSSSVVTPGDLARSIGPAHIRNRTQTQRDGVN